MCAWDEFSEYLLENRVPTSADFNTYPIRIFYLNLGSVKSWHIKVCDLCTYLDFCTNWHFLNNKTYAYTYAALNLQILENMSDHWAKYKNNCKRM